MAAPGIDELITTTLRHRKKKIADAITRHSPLLYMLKEARNVDLIGGGRTISCPLEYAENPNFAYYSDYGAISIAPANILTSAEYQWKQWAASVTISGREELINSGPEEVISRFKQRIRNAEKTISNNLAIGVYSDGSGGGGLQIHGLQLLASDGAGSVVGGIDSSQWAFWESQRTLATGISSANAYAQMETLFLSMMRNNDQPKVIVTSNAYWKFYSQSLQQQARYMSQRMADSGFAANLMFYETPVVFDGGIDSAAPPGMYYINTDFVKMAIHRKRNNVTLPGPTRALNQDANSKIIAGMGNLITSNRRYAFGRLT